MGKGTYFPQDVGRNESCELRHRPTFCVKPLPELAALGPAYGAWPYGQQKQVPFSSRVDEALDLVAEVARLSRCINLRLHSETLASSVTAKSRTMGRSGSRQTFEMHKFKVAQRNFGEFRYGKV